MRVSPILVAVVLWGLQVHAATPSSGLARQVASATLPKSDHPSLYDPGLTFAYRGFSQPLTKPFALSSRLDIDSPRYNTLPPKVRWAELGRVIRTEGAAGLVTRQWTQGRRPLAPRLTLGASADLSQIIGGEGYGRTL